MYRLELAKENEAEFCYLILDMGRKFQREQGFIQWDEEYPTFDIVKEDIKNQKGYVLRTAEGDIAAYMYISFDGDEWYDKSDIWSKNEPYGVLHRLAIHDRFRNKGLADECFRLFEELCKSNGIYYARVDTMKPNKRMQHIFAKNGYTYRGEVYFVDGLCIAYDKSL